MTGFQTQVQVKQGLGVPGDFANGNPYFVVPAGEGAIVAGSSAIVGTMVWVTNPLDNDGSPSVANSFGSGPVTGFLGRRQVGVLNGISEASQRINPGFPLTVYNGGDFLVKNDGTSEALFGQVVYANVATGLLSFGPANSAATSFNGNASIAGTSASFVGGIENNVLTVLSVNSGNVWPGEHITGTGISSNTIVQSQISGIPGYTGTFYVNNPDQATAANVTVSGTYGLLTVNSVVSGAITVGSQLSGAGGGNAVLAGSTVTQLLTSTGGTGTAVVNPTQNVSSSTITAVGTVQTKWIATSSGPVGAIIKISDHPFG